jgi:hypothetical protein
MDYENGAYSDYVSSYDTSGNRIEGTFVKNDSAISMGTSSSGDNTYLQVRTPKSASASGTTKIEISNSLPEGSLYTFESRIRIVGGTGGYNFARLKFVNKSGGEALNLYLKMTPNAAGATNKPHFAVSATGSNSSLGAGTTLFNLEDKAIAAETWFTLRVELYYSRATDSTDPAAVDAAKANTFMKLYVDDCLAYDGLASWAVGADITHAEIEHVSAAKVALNIAYDDISFTRTDKAYVKSDSSAQ